MNNSNYRNVDPNGQKLTNEQNEVLSDTSDMRKQAKIGIMSDNKCPMPCDIMSKIEILLNLILVKTSIIQEEYSLDQTLSESVEFAIKLCKENSTNP